MPYKDNASATSMITATNTMDVSYWKSPTFSRKPSPAFASTSSPTIAPITDRVAPMRSPPNNTGKDAGISSFEITCQRVARRDFIMSYNEEGTARTPTTVFTNTGKNTIKAQMTTLASSPCPSQMASKGANATEAEFAQIVDYLATAFPPDK